MMIKERTDKMIEAGAAIELHTPGNHQTTELLLAAARWDTNPKRLRWCAVYPDDQHHIHETLFTKAEVEHDRDIALYDKAGRMMVYICPVVESGLDLTAATALLKAWQADMALPHNQKEFDDFFAEG